MTVSDSIPEQQPTVQRRSRPRQTALLAAAILLVLVLLGLFLTWQTMIFMPGQSYRGPLPAPDSSQDMLGEQLRVDVEFLSERIGERNLRRYGQLVQSADYIEQQFEAAGYQVQRQTYPVRDLTCNNLEAEIRGSTAPDEIVIVGAHYDSAMGTPGANDNASGTAALLALARRFAGQQTQRTLRFVAFTNEEMPYFQTPDMGSLVYARRCRERDENLAAVIVLETIGYYRQESGSQQYPVPLSAFYPSEGNFIAVVGNVASRKLVRRVVDSFRRHQRFPTEGGAVPASIDGVGWSDHWSFWEEGYPAVMITDTALFRYPYYHHPEDTPDKLNFDDMARVVDGLQAVIGELVGDTAVPQRKSQIAD
jgi:hypothetical protein